VYTNSETNWKKIRPAYYGRGDILEDGTCQDDRYSCFEDLDNDIYAKSPSDCNFKEHYQPKYVFYDVKSSERRDLGQCENIIQRERTKVAFETASKLGWGAACDYQLEQDVPIFLAEKPENSV
jgi:hypothetical protein